jgi:hypothetical protein
MEGVYDFFKEKIRAHLVAKVRPTLNEKVGPPMWLPPHCCNICRAFVQRKSRVERGRARLACLDEAGDMYHLLW